MNRRCRAENHLIALVAIFSLVAGCAKTGKRQQHTDAAEPALGIGTQTLTDGSFVLMSRNSDEWFQIRIEGISQRIASGSFNQDDLKWWSSRLTDAIECDNYGVTHRRRVPARLVTDRPTAHWASTDSCRVAMWDWSSSYAAIQFDDKTVVYGLAQDSIIATVSSANNLRDSPSRDPRSFDSRQDWVAWHPTDPAALVRVFDREIQQDQLVRLDLSPKQETTSNSRPKVIMREPAHLFQVTSGFGQSQYIRAPMQVQGWVSDDCVLVDVFRGQWPTTIDTRLTGQSGSLEERKTTTSVLLRVSKGTTKDLGGLYRIGSVAGQRSLLFGPGNERKLLRVGDDCKPELTSLPEPGTEWHFASPSRIHNDGSIWTIALKNGTLFLKQDNFKSGGDVEEKIREDVEVAKCLFDRMKLNFAACLVKTKGLSRGLQLLIFATDDPKKQLWLPYDENRSLVSFASNRPRPEPF